jgi:hypothetical protein
MGRNCARARDKSLSTILTKSRRGLGVMTASIIITPDADRRSDRRRNGAGPDRGIWGSATASEPARRRGLGSRLLFDPPSAGILGSRVDFRWTP